MLVVHQFAIGGDNASVPDNVLPPPHLTINVDHKRCGGVLSEVNTVDVPISARETASRSSGSSSGSSTSSSISGHRRLVLGPG